MAIGAHRQPRSILLLNESLAGGGAERQLTHLANQLAEEGDRIAVATWASPEIADRYRLSEAIDRIHLRKREPRGGRLARALGTAIDWLRLVALIRRLKPDAIVSFSDASNILAAGAAGATGRPAVLSIRSNPDAVFQMNPHWRRLALAAYRRSVVVAQTEAVADWCRRHGARAVRVVPNMLRGAMPEGRSMPQRLPLVASVGSLFGYKGHDVLLRAFAEVKRSHPQWRLTILGEGPERNALERLADELGVREQVSLPGYAEDVNAILAEAGIFVLSSRFEGFPNALVEAMAMGTAPISTDCDFGPRDIIADGEDGLLVPVDDVEALAAALDRLMDDAGLRERLARQAPLVRARYSAEQVTARWRKAIDSAIGDGEAQAATR